MISEIGTNTDRVYWPRTGQSTLNINLLGDAKQRERMRSKTTNTHVVFLISKRAPVEVKQTSS